MGLCLAFGKGVACPVGLGGAKENAQGGQNLAQAPGIEVDFEFSTCRFQKTMKQCRRTLEATQNKRQLREGKVRAQEAPEDTDTKNTHTDVDTDA